MSVPCGDYLRSTEKCEKKKKSETIVALGPGTGLVETNSEGEKALQPRPRLEAGGVRCKPAKRGKGAERGGKGIQRTVYRLTDRETPFLLRVHRHRQNWSEKFRGSKISDSELDSEVIAAS